MLAILLLLLGSSGTQTEHQMAPTRTPTTEASSGLWHRPPRFQRQPSRGTRSRRCHLLANHQVRQATWPQFRRHHSRRHLWSHFHQRHQSQSNHRRLRHHRMVPNHLFRQPLLLPGSLSSRLRPQFQPNRHRLRLELRPSFLQHRSRPSWRSRRHKIQTDRQSHPLPRLPEPHSSPLGGHRSRCLWPEHRVRLPRQL